MGKKPHLLRRNIFFTLLAVIVLCSACAGSTSETPAPSWKPTPTKMGQMNVLATTVGKGVDSEIVLHTEHGDVNFWSGVNLGATTPGHNPGELSISDETYRRWFVQMGNMGVRFLRIYTIHTPAFYKELLSYNTAHPNSPLYLVQGVYMPDETYIATQDLWNEKATQIFDKELHDASLAVHGKLHREVKTSGRSDGRWTADVSPWLAAWIIGVEWDPVATSVSDSKNKGKPNFSGKYFHNQGINVTSTEQWIAARMNNLATHEAQQKLSMPIAFVNWPTADPLKHPNEPLPQEDLVGVDANHIGSTPAWPGGTFASMHTYPYYPDFLRQEPGYKNFSHKGTTDAYAGYLTDLKKHYGKTNLPVMVTEFGVPSSLGSAHYGTNGRDQGQHSEQDAMSFDADMLRLIKDVGMAGGLVFSWADEWFKFTWNTIPRQSVVNAERRSLWHDPLTNEQWFGIVAQDPVPNGWYTIYENRSVIEQVSVSTDASYVHLRVQFENPPTSPVWLYFTVGDDVRSGYAVEVDPNKNTAVAYVRPDLDPIKLDGLNVADLPKTDNLWNVQRMNVNRSFIVDGKKVPAEFVEVGILNQGTWDTSSEMYNSLSTWSLNDKTLNLRLPWSMLGLGDPSSKTQVVPTVSGTPKGVAVEDILVDVKVNDETIEVGRVKWDPWQKTNSVERLKAGSNKLEEAFKEVSN